MKIPIPALVGTLFLLGLLCGMAGKRFMSSRPVEEPLENVAAASGGKPVVESKMTTIARSSDTVENLLALSEYELYARLAHWLLDASEEELIEFRDAYQQLGGKDFEIGRLTLVHWVRLNSQAAVVVSPDDPDAEEKTYHRWEAWAIHDPNAALTADAAAAGKMNRSIWHAISVFHPRWFIANFDRVPDDIRESVISSMNAQADVPVIAEKSLEAAEPWNHPELLSAVFVNTLKNSPLEAWEWYQKHKAKHPDFFGSQSDVIEYITSYTAQPSQAWELAQIVDTMEPGSDKWMLEAKAVELLSRTDPEAALAMARRSGSGGIRGRLLAAAGKALVFDQPDVALEIADEIFSSRSGVLNRPEIRFADGTHAEASTEDHREIHDFLQGLCVKRPEQLMQSLLKHDLTAQTDTAFKLVAGTWANQSQESCGEWLGTQVDPRILGPGVDAMVSSLVGKECYSDALDWAVSPHATDVKAVTSIFKKWYSDDSAAADEWLKNANLPEKREQQLLKAVKK